MLDQLSEKFEKILKKLRGTGVLTEENIAEALKEVRLALLEADVNFKIVKDFVDRVRQKAIGQEVLQSLTPGHHVVKVVWDELRAMMGQERAGLSLASAPPTVIMMVGLQGSGKTTTSGKLAKFFKQQGKRVLLVAADPRRPAAADQLSSIGRTLDVDVHRQDQPGTTAQDVVRVCRAGVERARTQGFDLVVLDTGGRLHVDDELMNELAAVKSAVMPHEVLLVADAMTGQDAVTMASQFDQRVGLTGVILTKVEGDARGGALLSIRAVTGKPVKFLGVGEKLEALELFHPDRMASRILGMGDMLSLIEKAQSNIDAEKAKEMERKMRTAEFTFDDFLEQMEQVRNLGPLDQIMDMLPGMNKMKGMKDMKVDEKQIGRVEIPQAAFLAVLSSDE